MESVLEIFTEAQKSITSHKAGAKKIQSLLLDNKIDHENLIQYIFHGCIDRVLVSVKSNLPQIDKSIQFISTMLTNFDEAILCSALHHICSRLSSNNKVVRERCCNIISLVFSKLSQKEVDLSDEMLNTVSEFLVPRLKDKIPAVRISAITACCPLISLDNDSDEVLLEIIRLLRSDSSCSVRIAAIEQIPISKRSLPIIVERLNEIKPEVRISTLNVLAKDNRMKYLSTDMKSKVIKLGLTDREEKVRTAAKKLLLGWIHSMKGDNKVISSLKMINPVQYEECSVLLSTTILEEVQIRESSLNDLSSFLKESTIQWQEGINFIQPQDILWVYLRCNFALRYYTPDVAFEIFESIYPDNAKLCGLLAEFNTFSLDGNKKLQFVLKYIFKLMAMMDSTDIGGIKEIGGISNQLMFDVNILTNLLDNLLKVYQKVVHSYPGAIPDGFAFEDYLVECAKNKCETASQKESDEMISEEMIVSNQERALQIIEWVVTQSVGVLRTNDEPAAYVPSLLQIVLSSIQSPMCDIRYMGVKCLGLLCLNANSLCQQYQPILLQVAAVDIEEPSIRCIALQSVIDLAAVNVDQYRDNIELSSLILRIQERSAEPQMIRLATEGAIKLFFCGSLTDPKVFAHLLQFFFITELTNPSAHSNDTQSDDGAVDSEKDANLGTVARLQQVLSLFLQSFLHCDGRCEEVLMKSIPDLINDVSNLIRSDGTTPAILMHIVKHLITMSENLRQAVPSKESKESIMDIKSSLSERITASICRELLKLGHSKIDLQIVKEYFKVMMFLSPYDWISSKKAKEIKMVMEIIRESCVKQLDKTSMKSLEQIIEACQFHLDPNVQGLRHDFQDLAPGLSNLVMLCSKDGEDCYSDHEELEENHNPNDSKIQKNSSYESSRLELTSIEDLKLKRIRTRKVG